MITLLTAGRTPPAVAAPGDRAPVHSIPERFADSRVRSRRRENSLRGYRRAGEAKDAPFPLKLTPGPPHFVHLASEKRGLVTMRSAVGSVIVLIMAVACGSAPSALAMTMKECSAKYQSAQQAGTLNGMKWNDFRKTECGTTGPQAAAAP